MGRIPLLDGNFEMWDGEVRSTDAFRGRPLLINLWSAHCGPCLEELKEWAEQRDVLNSLGPEILALCVDGLDRTYRDARGGLSVLDRIGFSFASGQARKEFVEGLDIVHRTYVELQAPLPVPCSVLLDGRGRLAAIYKGRVEVKRLVQDIQLLDATLAEQRNSAVPFRGRWASQPFRPDPWPIMTTLVNAEQSDKALAYLRRYTSVAGENARRQPLAVDPSLSGYYRRLGDMLVERNDTESAYAAYGELFRLQPDDIDLHCSIGVALFARGHLRAARKHLEFVLGKQPAEPVALYHLGLMDLSRGQHRRAIGRFQKVLEFKPDDVECHFHLANALHAIGRTKMAVHHFRESLVLRPGWPLAANNLAWILATDADEGVRNPAEAVRLAEQASQAYEFREPSSLATLAVACAAAGRFDHAVKHNRQAINLLRKEGARDELLLTLRERQPFYERKEFPELGR
jgi:Flp pilus assembly protein TadD